MPHESSSGVVVFRSGRRRAYLLLHYVEGHWDLPKGHIEKGESGIAAAIRETREETGITDLEFIDGFLEKIDYAYERDGKTWHKEVLFHLARTKTTKVRLSDEHAGFEWLPFEEAVSRLTYDNAKGILSKAEAFLGNNRK